jgi:prepilin-type N-terminal cleavage/methylation domain-containing protein
MNRVKNNHGFSLIEVLIGTAIFVVASIALIGSFSKVLEGINLLRIKSAATNLATEQFEIIRNLPYGDVGEISGIPSGVIAHTQNVTRDSINFVVTTTIRNIDDPYDGTIGGTPNDLSPADNKLVQLDIDCASCKNFQTLSYSSKVAPKNLETASTNGALFVKVFDANGQPLAGAQVHIVNSLATSTITIDDETNNSGLLQVVDAPPGTEAYQVTVSNTGYSSDKTYTSGAVGNPHPSKPHATVIIQKVTQVSFSIDKTSSINFSTVTPTCQVVGGVPFTLIGAKQIGTSPTVYKYNTSQTTSGAGALNLSGLEWDTYTPILTSASYNLAGSNPLLPISLSPNSTQNVKLVVTPKDPSAVLVTVKDGTTNLPLSDAVVTLTLAGASTTLTTGQGYFRQTDWSGGSGQTDFSSGANKYFNSDGNIDTGSPAGELKLKKTGSNYSSSGILTSSTFDTGLTSNFQQILWQPADQATSTGANSVKFQIATSIDNTATTTWTYTGPDGTASTYYTINNQNISSANNGRQYLRYKALLSTASSTVTPNVSDVSITYTSSCTPPGQVLFNSMSSGNYTLTVSKSGYQTYSSALTVGSTWQQQEVLLTP